jgi:hypothetical protein
MIYLIALFGVCFENMIKGSKTSLNEGKGLRDLFERDLELIRKLFSPFAKGG